ncbi:MAG: endopeptidase La [Gemmatimonadetes bacterium]|nr:MAG: endopeptidase La [Gemmatimonadota bacterium]PYP53547.1 MAG: endopeptidase La [Gemmatimonadota bacterium]
MPSNKALPQTFQRDNESIPTSDRIPVLPLRDVVIFPYVVIPLLVGRPASLAAIEAALAEDKIILLVAQRDGEKQEPAAADLHRTGVIGRVVQVSRLPTGTTRVLVEGIARARVTRYIPSGNVLRAAASPFPFEGAKASQDAAETEALSRRVLNSFEEYVSLHRRIPAEIVSIIQSTDSLERQAFGVAAHVAVRFELRQSLLEADTLRGLLEMLAELLSGEIELLRLERKIDDDVRGAMFQNQREFYLQEQLRVIHRELGEEDSDDFAELEAQIKKKALPSVVEERTLRELRKLRRMPPMSPEFTVARNFVDWIVSIPWTERTDEVLDVSRAGAILDADHYGLDEIKDRILDFIAVMSLVGRLDGQILCLVGPPGVGKTSLGRSIARALGRKFVRMALGGVRDEAEIRGHRRTYIGSMPGRIIQAMRRAEVINPVILLDEVDKLGQDFRGDPAAALLEVLDPEQNTTFNDNYLEVDYDLSQVLFITTANSLAGIPEALRDRMEILRIAGYLDHEKLAIARQYLLPRQIESNGLKKEEVVLEPDVLMAIMRGYTREAGVRELERRIARVARKLARKRAEVASDGATQTVSVADLKELLGAPPFDPDDTSLDDKIGVASGLAYTSVGGEVLEIEVSVVKGRGKVQLTGTLGDVMKESASAALSYARARARALGIESEFYRTKDIHIHMPAGATPKDGPSAGIAIATAVISALTGVPVRGDVAMTGEITLRGRVLPIGGLKEKSVAAHRNKVSDVIIPHGNARDVDELPEEVRASVRFHPVKTMDEVLAMALRPQPAATTSSGEALYDSVTH